MQERNTARDAVLSVLPDAEIEYLCHDSYPIFVRVSLNDKEIWKNEQRALFRKNASRREQSISEIKENLRKVMTN
ncbi:hypothetical protein AKO1_008722 [Acrasis kona]|uniref:Uncharacterized protein n=1 Tax=Acrasis kona TaxID=1008807 RepID=A0AAW2ZG73_9EUKA